MFRLKLKIDDTRMVIGVDKNTPCSQVLPLVQARLQLMPKYKDTYFLYDKAEMLCDDELYQFLGDGPVHSLVTSNDLIQISSSMLPTGTPMPRVLSTASSDRISGVKNGSYGVSPQIPQISQMSQTPHVQQLQQVPQMAQMAQIPRMAQMPALEQQQQRQRSMQLQQSSSNITNVRHSNINQNGREEEKLSELKTNDVNVTTAAAVGLAGNEMIASDMNGVAYPPTKAMIPTMPAISPVNLNLLKSQSKIKNNYLYRRASKEISHHIVAINILIDILPMDCLIEVFNYCEFDCSPYIQNGWTMNKIRINDYPTLYIENVQNIINQPSLIITIGLPGSGKTTWAKERCSATQSAETLLRTKREVENMRISEIRREFSKNYPSTVIAADDYFTIFNNDQFDPSLLGKAHQWCREQIFNKLVNGQTVSVNNTHTTLQEMHAYVAIASLSNFPHKIVFAVMPQLDIDILESRNSHGVDSKKIKKMKDRFLRWYKKRPPSTAAVFKAGPFRGPSEQNICKNVSYTGIFFDDETMERLRTHFVGVSRCDALLSQIVTHMHVTFKFIPTWDEVIQLPFGKTVDVRIIGYVNHELVQCFLVDVSIENNLKLTRKLRSLCKNKYAHITVAFDKDNSKAHYSNDILQHGNVTPLINVENDNNGNGNGNNNNNFINGNGSNYNSCEFGSLRVQGTCGAYGTQMGLMLSTPEFVIEYNKKGNKGKNGKKRR